MKSLRLVTTVEDDDLELVFVLFGPISLGLRLNNLPKWLVDLIRPSLNKNE